MRDESLPWEAMKRRYLEGAGAKTIANEFGCCSHQAITQRAKKEGWAALRPVAPEEPQEHKAILIPEWIKTLGNSWEPRRVKALELAAQGAPPNKALAMAIGVAESTFASWLAKDEAFRTALAQAKGEFLTAIPAQIAAHVGKDWKAGAWILERSPETRKDYAPANYGTQAAIQINLGGFSRDSIKLPVIDVQQDKAPDEAA